MPHHQPTGAECPRWIDAHGTVPGRIGAVANKAGIGDESTLLGDCSLDRILDRLKRRDTESSKVIVFRWSKNDGTELFQYRGAKDTY